MNERVPGTKIAETLLTRPGGATMPEIIAATGGPQYNLLKRLEHSGYKLRKVKEGNVTRYYATPPAAPSFEAMVTGQGQVTIPKEIRERLRLRPGGKVRFTVREDGGVVLGPVSYKLSDLFGILGKPPRPLKLEEIDDAIADAVVEKHRRSLSESGQ